ncbi:MAG: hypothetical protein NZ922_00685, partial [Candidatus Methanomethyliaceae archaeon]|nr:hypothetical protein [Candidatus Methanomethyliaceae archaeon]
LIREQGLPLIAFPRNHKLSMPIRILVSIGKHIILSCRIPPVIKSSLLCTSKEFDGMEIVAKEGGVIIKGLKDFAIFRTQYNNTFPF